MKIVIAIDKFKGSATSAQLSHCIEQTIREALPQANVTSVPIADGGDGTMQAIKQILGKQVEERTVKIHSFLPDKLSLTANYLLDPITHTAYMDLATTCGLALVPPLKRNVMMASTSGTGMMIVDAIRQGASHIVLGLGGSATCDGGVGILDSLGFNFLDKKGNTLLPAGCNLHAIDHIDKKNINHDIKDIKFTLLTDVDNPLLGKDGAAAVFAPQKGASPQDVEQLENGFKNFIKLMPYGEKIASIPGAGAAGGVAAGMIAFLDADIVHGIDWILEKADFENTIANAQLIITGEGRIDRQTAMGKAPAGVLLIAKKHNIPVVALCGSLAPGTDVSKLGFASVIPVTPPGMTLEEAMDTRTTLDNVKKAITTLIHSWV